MNTVSHFEEVVGYNDQSLTELSWAIEASSGEFSFTLAHCNYTSLRSQLIQRLQKLCSAKIHVINLGESTTTLYTTIQEELKGKRPSALMIFGLERIRDLPQVFSSANKVREEFRKNFPFPLVLWVNDNVLEQLIQWAPDFKSWATTTKFVAPTDMLLKELKQGIDTLITWLLNPHTVKPFSDVDIYRWEVHAALQELHDREQSLEPELNADINLVLGREAEDKAKESFELGQTMNADHQMEAARRYYQQSLKFWQYTGNLERQGILLLHLGQNYYHQAEYYAARSNRTNEKTSQNIGLCWEESKQYFKRCFYAFKQVHRLDLIAENINQLGEVLQHQEDWGLLQKLAEKSLLLHQTDEYANKLAQDYCFLASSALHQSQWQDASQYAQQALDIFKVKILEYDDRQQYQTCLLLLAHAQKKLGKIAEAIADLEEARKIGEQARKVGFADPKIDLQVLDALHSLYFQQKQYLEAFRVKHEHYSVEQQYGLRAFIGPGRLKSQRPTYVSTTETVQPAIVAQEILASGRQQDIDELIRRIEEHRFKLTILYGQSGVGKSSVIEAGLIPALQQKTTRSLVIVPILLRSYTHWAEELGKQLTESLRALSVPCIAELDSTDAILKQLKQNEQFHLLTVLIFDQFEEFFFVYHDSAERKRFSEFFCQCFNISEVKIVLSLREDYLHYLLRFDQAAKRTDTQGDILRNILNENNLYYVGNLSPDDTKVLLQTLTKRCQAYQPELIDALVKELADDRGYVRPIELQVVGAQLEEDRITTLEQYLENGPYEKLMQRYLDRVIADCGEENIRAAELALYLLTDENNTRPMKTQAQLESDLVSIAKDLFQEASKLNLVLQIFVEAGLVLLLRESPDDRYQLVHDYLVTIIRHQQEPRLPQLKIELEKEIAQRQQAEEERDRALQDLAGRNCELEHLNNSLVTQKSGLERVRQNLVAALVGLFILSVLAGTFSIQARRNEIKVKTSQARSLLVSENELDALVTSLDAFDSVKELGWVETMFSQLNKQNIQQDIQQVLQAALYSVREFNRLEGHQGSVYSVDMSSEYIATASEDGTVQLWNRNGSRSAFTLTGHQGPVYSVSFDPKGEYIATVGEDGYLRLWCRDCQWNCPYKVREHQGPIYSVSYSPDGLFIATAGEDRTVKLWDRTGQHSRTLEGHQRAVRSVSFDPNPDSQRLATADEDGIVKLWNRNGELLNSFAAQQGIVRSVAFSPDGQLLATAGGDGTVKLWKQDGTFLKTFTGHQGSVYSVAFNPKGTVIASASTDHTAKLWSINGDLLQTLTGHEEPVYQVRFSTNGTLATASADTTVKLWRSNPRLILGHSSNITAIGFSPDQQRIVSAGKDGTVKLWSADSQYLRTLEGHQASVSSISFSPNGQTIATASADTTVKLWNRDGELVTTLTGHQGAVSSVSFDPQGQYIATASDDGTIKLWNREGQVIQTFEVRRGHIASVKFSSDGETIIAISKNSVATISDYSITFWNRNGEVIRILDGQELKRYVEDGEEIDQIKISPNGQILAVTSRANNTVTLWDLTKEIKVGTLQHEKTIKEMNFSPDGQLIVTTGKDKNVKLWSLTDQAGTITEKAQFAWHYDGFAENLTISPNQQLIAMSSITGRIILWDWNQGVNELETLSCERVQDYLKVNQKLDNNNRDLCDSVIRSQDFN